MIQNVVGQSRFESTDTFFTLGGSEGREIGRVAELVSPYPMEGAIRTALEALGGASESIEKAAVLKSLIAFFTLGGSEGREIGRVAELVSPYPMEGAIRTALEALGGASESIEKAAVLKSLTAVWEYYSPVREPARVEHRPA